jgi:hypothetical protein
MSGCRYLPNLLCLSLDFGSRKRDERSYSHRPRSHRVFSFLNYEVGHMHTAGRWYAIHLSSSVPRPNRCLSMSLIATAITHRVALWEIFQTDIPNLSGNAV